MVLASNSLPKLSILAFISLNVAGIIGIRSGSLIIPVSGVSLGLLLVLCSSYLLHSVHAGSRVVFLPDYICVLDILIETLEDTM